MKEASGVCRYCKSVLEAGAAKCRVCGEWIDGHWHVGGAGKVCLALIVALVLVMGAMAWSWVPSVQPMIASLADPVPRFTELVLSEGWMPPWMAIVLVMVASSFALVTRARLRSTLLALALALGLVALVISWWGIQLPLADLVTAIRWG